MQWLNMTIYIHHMLFFNTVFEILLTPYFAERCRNFIWFYSVNYREYCLFRLYLLYMYIYYIFISSWPARLILIFLIYFFAFLYVLTVTVTRPKASVRKRTTCSTELRLDLNKPIHHCCTDSAFTQGAHAAGELQVYVKTLQCSFTKKNIMK